MGQLRDCHPYNILSNDNVSFTAIKGHLIKNSGLLKKKHFLDFIKA